MKNKEDEFWLIEQRGNFSDGKKMRSASGHSKVKMSGSEKKLHEHK